MRTNERLCARPACRNGQPSLASRRANRPRRCERSASSDDRRRQRRAFCLAVVCVCDEGQPARFAPTGQQPVLGVFSTKLFFLFGFFLLYFAGGRRDDNTRTSRDTAANDSYAKNGIPEATATKAPVYKYVVVRARIRHGA